MRIRRMFGSNLAGMYDEGPGVLGEGEAAIGVEEMACC